MSGSPRCARRLVVAALLSAMLGTEPARANEPHWVCPPGRESFFLDALGGAPIAGCRLEKASIAKDHVIADYRCAADQVSLELHPPGAELAAAARTAKFTLVSRGAAPALLVDGLRERILKREAGFTWIEASAAVPLRGAAPDRAGPRDSVFERALGIRWHAGQTAALTVVFAMLSLGGVSLLASRRAGEKPARSSTRPLLSPLAGLLGGAFIAAAVLVVSRFAFFQDDFFQLIRATDHPFEIDDSLRFFSGTLFYGVGLRLGTPWFMSVNLVTWLGSVALFHALLRRAGHERDEALIAACLYGFAPGYFQLARTAIGFQTSAALGLYFAILLLVDSAARTRLADRTRRAALLVLSLGLTGAGVFVKYPMMSIVPFFAWVWGKRIVRNAPSPLSHHAFYAAFALIPGVLLLLAHPADPRAGELTKAGVSAIARNLISLTLHLTPPLASLGLAVVVLAVGAALGASPADGTKLGRVYSAFREDLRGLAERRWGPFVLLAAIAVVPFLFNAQYFARYYAVACWAWLAAVAAPLLATMARRLSGFEHWLVASLAVAALLPIRDVVSQFDTSSNPAPMLDEARRALSGQPAPCGLRLDAACPTPEATRASAEELVRFCDLTQTSDGLRWVTGWHRVDVVLDGPEKRGKLSESCTAPLRLRYCSGRGMWVEKPTR